MEEEMFSTFARLHPVEAYDYNPEAFCKFMREEGYNMTDEEITKLVDETRDEE
jgi:hypothetical protein